jgi:hypothetical protein
VYRKFLEDGLSRTQIMTDIGYSWLEGDHACLLRGCSARTCCSIGVREVAYREGLNVYSSQFASSQTTLTSPLSKIRTPPDLLHDQAFSGNQEM